VGGPSDGSSVAWVNIMALITNYCCVLQGNVTRVIDIDGEVVSVICPEFETQRGICHVKESAFQGGMLSELFRRADGTPLDNPVPRCTLA
jgi:hypothetical protein